MLSPSAIHRPRGWHWPSESMDVLRMLILPWIARQALPHGPLVNVDHKHTDTGHPLPEFYLQTTCKFAGQSAAWITVLAM